MRGSFMHLNNRGRDLLDKYTAGMAQQFGARDTSRYFSLNDPQENALRLALLESVEFPGHAHMPGR